MSPANIILTGVNPEGLLAKKIKVSGLEGIFETYSNSYTEIMPKENLVYLTADSENEITDFDHSKAYIIGGIVDWNRYKNLCLEKALGDKISHAKLPLGNMLKWDCFSTVLTVNHVIDIILA